MKNLKTLFATICLSLLITTTTKAQDDANCGIVIDGVIADSISNWNFDKLSVVFPLNQDWKNLYHHLDIKLLYLQDVGSNAVNEYKYAEGSGFNAKDLESDYSDASHVVITFFHQYVGKGKDRIWSTGGKDYHLNSYAYVSKKDYGKKETIPTRYALIVTVKGVSITSYKEVYSQTAGGFIKSPIFDEGKLLYKSKKVVYPVCITEATRQEARETGCPECKSILDPPCQVYGQKFNLQIDKANYEGTSEKIKKGGSSKVEVKTNTTTKTTVTKTTTTKLADGLVPYVEKWDNGKIKIQGQKNKDDELQGTWKYYDESGKLWKTEEYKDNELISTKEN